MLRSEWKEANKKKVTSICVRWIAVLAAASTTTDLCVLRTNYEITSLALETVAFVVERRHRDRSER